MKVYQKLQKKKTMEIGFKKIPITISPFFFVLVGIISYLNGNSLLSMGIFAIAIFISLLLHELGHALTALSFGQRVRISFVGFGGITHRFGPKLKLWQEFAITLNGPLMGIFIFTSAYILNQNIHPTHSPLLFTTVAIFFWINVLWTILNLVPVQPLDGGQLLKIVLTMLFGLMGTKIALFLSLLCAALLALLFLITPHFIVGILFLILTLENFKLWKESLHLSKSDQIPAIQTLLNKAKKAMQQGEYQVALEEFELVRSHAKKGVLYLQATEAEAFLLNDIGEKPSAYQLLQAEQHKLSTPALRLLHHLSYATGHFQRGIELGKKVYQFFPDYHTALINALCHAAKREAFPSIEWLKCAIQAGLPNLEETLAKPEWDGIRNTEEFATFLQDH